MEHLPGRSSKRRCAAGSRGWAQPSSCSRSAVSPRSVRRIRGSTDTASSRTASSPWGSSRSRPARSRARAPIVSSRSVFTAPVERRDWLAAKILVLFTLAGAYYLALVPMMLVYTYHVGLPLLLGKFLVWTPGILVASIAVGTLIGVLFIGRSIAAPAATGMGVLLAYAGLVPLQELMVAQGTARRAPATSRWRVPRCSSRTRWGSRSWRAAFPPRRP